jgi:hypothetical protein
LISGVGSLLHRRAQSFCETVHKATSRQQASARVDSAIALYILAILT